MALEEFANPAPENARAVAVDDANARQAGEERAVQVFLQFAGGLIHSPANQVDLHAQFV